MKILLIGGLGYIGTYLNTHLIKMGVHVDICDYACHDSSNFDKVKFPIDYKDLSSKDLFDYSAILWFAGHSSVHQSTIDPKGAINNNAINLIQLLQKIPKPEILFLYASTASLYSGMEGFASEEDLVAPSINPYDISKFTFDYLVNVYHKNFIGLRMGTISGYSENVRAELIFNKMCLDAHHKGIINVKNGNSRRSILFLSDLARIVELGVIHRKLPPGLFNAASFTSTVMDLACIVKKYFDARIVVLPDVKTYSFAISTKKIKNFGYEVEKTVDEQISEYSKFIHMINTSSSN